MLKAPTRSTLGRVSWCGPMALSILSGLPYDDTYTKMVRSINRVKRAKAKKYGYHPETWTKKSYRGVDEGELKAAGKTLGLNISWDWTLRGTTLLTFTRMHTIKDKAYLILAGHHYVVIYNGVVYDNTKSGPHPIDEYPRAKMARLLCVAEVKPKKEAFAA